MRIEQIQAFLAVAESGNFGQAARQFGITQSTVSRQIQALEGTVGMPLFHRTAQAKLTIAGEKLLPRARRICQEWQQACQELHDLQAGKQPELCVAAIHSVCSYYLPPILQQFCQDFPQVQLRVTALGSDRALKVLRDGLVDIAVVMNNRYLTSSTELAVEVLYEEPIEVLMAADHPLARQDRVSWESLFPYPQVIFKDGYGMQRLVQDWFAQQQQECKVVMELNTLDAFRGVVRRGHIIALLPQTALWEARQDPTLAVRAIAPLPMDFQGNGKTPMVPSRQVVLVTTTDRLTIPPIAHFCHLVKTLKAEGGPELVSLHKSTGGR